MLDSLKRWMLLLLDWQLWFLIAAMLLLAYAEYQGWIPSGRGLCIDGQFPPYCVP